MDDRDHRDRNERQAAEKQRIAQIERRRRDHHRRQEHQREGIFDSARQVEKGAKLQHVISEIDRRLAIGEAVGRRIADSKDNVEERAHRNGDHAGDDRQRIVEAEMHDPDGCRLPTDSKPAQIAERAQPHAAARRTGPGDPFRRGAAPSPQPRPGAQLGRVRLPCLRARHASRLTFKRPFASCPKGGAVYQFVAPASQSLLASPVP